MSINIQTANGLVRISGEKITKEKIIESLGYTPADEQLLPDIKEDESGDLKITDGDGNVIFKVDEDGIHTTNVEATNELRAKKLVLDNVDIMNTIDDKISTIDDEISTIDDKISAIDDKIDEEIVNVNSQLEGIELIFTNHDANGDIHVTVEDKNTWYEHIEDNVVHVTIDDKVKWDNKSDFTGDYNNLENKPMEEDESGDLKITDEFGNIIFKIDEDGAHTTNIEAINELRAKKLIIDDIDIIDTIDNKIDTIDDKIETIDDKIETIDNKIETIDNKIDEEIININSQLEEVELVFTGHNTNDDIHVTAEDKNTWHEHVEDNTIHVTINDKVKWDNKSDFTGNYDSLENKPIEEDGSGDLCITDEFGNIIFKVDKDGVHTTNIHTTKINSKETVVQVDIVNGVLTLTDDKYQKTNMVTGTQIEFPEVIGFTEIHLYFDAETDMDLAFPDNCRWRVDSNIEQGKSYEIVATYNTIHWLVNIIVYS